MNHANFRKLSEARGVHLPVDMSDFKRTLSAQPCLVSSNNNDDLSPISRVTSDKSLPNERCLSASQSFAHRSTESNGKTMQLSDIRIFYSDGTCCQFTIENGHQARTSDLLRLVAQDRKITETVANNVFALWLTSPLLEVQLKPHHVAAEVRSKWSSILKRYTNADEVDIAFDEPLLILKRNVSLTIEAERMLEDCPEAVDLLYSDAKDEYLSGRYLVDVDTALDLAAMQILLDAGSYDGNEQETLDMIHDDLSKYVAPQHLSNIRSFYLFGLPIMECHAGLERDVFQRYKEYSDKYGDQDCRKKAYLRILRETPFYGAAFFDGKIEHRSTSSQLWDIGKRFLTAYMPLHKMNVRIGIQSKYITVVDPVKHEILLTQKLEDCNWLGEKDVPELFLHFPDLNQSSNKKSTVASSKKSTEAASARSSQSTVTEIQSKILQIFSPQSCMMLALMDSLDMIAVSEMGSALDLRQQQPLNDLQVHDQHITVSSNNESEGVPDEANTSTSTYHTPNTTVSSSSSKSTKASKSDGTDQIHLSDSPHSTVYPSLTTALNVSGNSGNRSPTKKVVGSSSSKDPTYENCKKLCVATLDPNGKLVNCQGSSLKRLFVPVH